MTVTEAMVESISDYTVAPEEGATGEEDISQEDFLQYKDWAEKIITQMDIAMPESIKDLITAYLIAHFYTVKIVDFNVASVAVGGYSESLKEPSAYLREAQKIANAFGGRWVNTADKLRVFRRDNKVFTKLTKYPKETEDFV